MRSRLLLVGRSARRSQRAHTSTHRKAQPRRHNARSPGHTGMRSARREAVTHAAHKARTVTDSTCPHTLSALARGCADVAGMRASSPTTALPSGATVGRAEQGKERPHACIARMRWIAPRHPEMRALHAVQGLSALLLRSASLSQCTHRPTGHAGQRPPLVPPSSHALPFLAPSGRGIRSAGRDARTPMARASAA